jgi:hypothetical protein
MRQTRAAKICDELARFAREINNLRITYADVASDAALADMRAAAESLTAAGIDIKRNPLRKSRVKAKQEPELSLS